MAQGSAKSINLYVQVDIVDDTTPQLGADLDVNGNAIVSVSNGDIDITPDGTGNVSLGNFIFDADQTVGAGQDNYVLTYDDGTGLISLEVASGGGASTLTDLTDVVSATNTDKFALMANGTTGYVGRALVEADISDLGTYSVTSHTHVLSDGATDVTATAAEVNLLDLSGLTAGWVLSADTATTASWKAPSGGGSGAFTEDGTNNSIYSAGAGSSLAAGGTYNFLALDGAGGPISTADHVIAIGNNAGNALTVGGSGSVYIGYQAGLLEPYINIAIGYQALAEATSAVDCTVLGYQAGRAITAGDYNVAIGTHAMGASAGAITGTSNTAIGWKAMNSTVITSAQKNVCIGESTGLAFSSGSYNIMLGYLAGSGMSTGSYNVILGDQAGTTATDASDNNVFIGRHAKPTATAAVSDLLIIHSSATGNDDPLIGGDFSTMGVTMGGSLRLTERADHIQTPTATYGEIWVKSATPNELYYTDDAGTDWLLNSAGGGGGAFTEDGTNNSIYSAGTGTALTATGTYNFLAIDAAGDSITTSDHAICVGQNAGTALTTGGSGGIYIGKDSGLTATMQNIAVGYESFNRGNNCNDSVVVGYQAGRGLTSGDYCIAIGTEAMGSSSATISGNSNIAIGRRALNSSSMSSAQHNIGIGESTAGACTTGDYNISIGYQAGNGPSTGSENIFIGHSAGGTSSTSSTNNVFIGQNAKPVATAAVSNLLIINSTASGSDDPLIGGDFSTKGVTMGGSLRFTERSDHIQTPTATFGEIWVKDDAPNTLWFTDDAGNDWRLNGFAASTTSLASLNVPHGSAPTTPVDGDIWTTTAGLYVRINGSTVGPLS